MQILFILLPQSKKTRLLEHWSHRKYERGKFIQRLVLRVQLEKEEKSLFGQTEQAAEENKQAGIWHILVVPAF